jgi:hypothetical protein
MSLLRIPKNPSRRDLLLFGLLWWLLISIAGLMALRHGGSWAMAAGLWTAAAVVPVVGWLSPPFLRWVYLAAIYLAFPLGFVLSYALLSLMYYLVLTPIGLLMRLLGHDPMQRRWDRTAKSYWTPRKAEENAERYFRQF